MYRGEIKLLFPDDISLVMERRERLQDLITQLGVHVTKKLKMNVAKSKFMRCSRD